MVSSAVLQGEAIVKISSILKSSSCNLLRKGSDIEGNIRLVETRIGPCKIKSKHKRLVNCIWLIGCNGGLGGSLAYQSLSADSDSLELEDSDQHVDEESSNGQEDDQRSYDAAFVVVLRLPADAPELGVGEEVKGIENVKHYYKYWLISFGYCRQHFIFIWVIKHLSSLFAFRWWYLSKGSIQKNTPSLLFFKLIMNIHRDNFLPSLHDSKY